MYLETLIQLLLETGVFLVDAMSWEIIHEEISIILNVYILPFTFHQLQRCIHFLSLRFDQALQQYPQRRDGLHAWRLERIPI
jgi:hypothetical protein